MQRSTDRILTTHVGSLIRPPELQDFLRARQKGAGFDEAAYDRCLAASVAAIVRHQAEAGIDVVSDGEFGKSISWSQYVLERLSGFERRPFKPGANTFQRGVDREKFAEFYAELDAREGVATALDSVCVGPISYTGQAQLQRDIDNFKAALEGRQGQRGVHAGGGAGERHPGSQERVLQERGRTDPGDRRGDAHRIQDDRRCRFHPSARRRACRHHVRPHGAAGKFRRVPQVGRAAHGRAQRRPSPDCRRTASAITCAGAAGRARMCPTCRSRTSPISFSA